MMGLSEEQITIEFENIISSNSTLDDLIEVIGLEPLTQFQSERMHRAILRYESAINFCILEREN